MRIETSTFCVSASHTLIKYSLDEGTWLTSSSSISNSLTPRPKETRLLPGYKLIYKLLGAPDIYTLKQWMVSILNTVVLNAYIQVLFNVPSSFCIFSSVLTFQYRGICVHIYLFLNLWAINISYDTSYLLMLRSLTLMFTVSLVTQ